MSKINSQSQRMTNPGESTAKAVHEDYPLEKALDAQDHFRWRTVVGLLGAELVRQPGSWAIVTGTR